MCLKFSFFFLLLQTMYGRIIFAPSSKTLLCHRHEWEKERRLICNGCRLWCALTLTDSHNRDVLQVHSLCVVMKSVLFTVTCMVASCFSFLLFFLRVGIKQRHTGGSRDSTGRLWSIFFQTGLSLLACVPCFAAVLNRVRHRCSLLSRNIIFLAVSLLCTKPVCIIIFRSRWFVRDWDVPQLSLFGPCQIRCAAESHESPCERECRSLKLAAVTAGAFAF